MALKRRGEIPGLVDAGRDLHLRHGRSRLSQVSICSYVLLSLVLYTYFFRRGKVHLCLIEIGIITLGTLLFVDEAINLALKAFKVGLFDGD